MIFSTRLSKRSSSKSSICSGPSRIVCRTFRSASMTSSNASFSASLRRSLRSCASLALITFMRAVQVSASSRPLTRRVLILWLSSVASTMARLMVRVFGLFCCRMASRAFICSIAGFRIMSALHLSLRYIRRNAARISLSGMRPTWQASALRSWVRQTHVTYPFLLVRRRNIVPQFPHRIFRANGLLSRRLFSFCAFLRSSSCTFSKVSRSMMAG